MSLNDREKELYELVHAMTLADVRNELEPYSLPTTGTRTSCTQRLFKYKRQQIPKESASKSNRSRRPITRQAAKTQGQAESTQLAQWQDNILRTVTEIQTAATKPPVEASTPLNRMNHYGSEFITQLVRKQKFVGTSIEVVIHEIQRVLAGEELHKPLNKVLERLIPLEKEYGGIVQELIAILPSEDSVNDEVTKWAAFQQQILGVTMLAEQQISIQSEIKDSKRQLSTTSHANPVSSHLRLPKFTLSEFTGNIIQWVSWWDQYKICIHENETLTDRDRFNYLRMYVKGSARRAIEYIEVSGNNYPKAIEALQRRYGRKRLIVEHLVESLLNIEKKDKVEARSLRGLYDVMVSRYRTLEAYEPKLAEAQRILVSILQSKFPDEIRRKWEFQLSKLENEEDDRLVTVEYLFDFLRSHVMSEEATDKSASKPRMSPKKTQSRQRRYAGGIGRESQKKKEKSRTD